MRIERCTPDNRIRQHKSAYLSIRHLSIRQPDNRIRQHKSAYLSIRQPHTIPARPKIGTGRPVVRQQKEREGRRLTPLPALPIR